MVLNPSLLLLSITGNADITGTLPPCFLTVSAVDDAWRDGKITDGLGCATVEMRCVSCGLRGSVHVYHGACQPTTRLLKVEWCRARSAGAAMDTSRWY